jgi:hypothetical protein
MLGLLLIFFNDLYMVIFIFLFVANTDLVVTLLIKSFKFMRGEKYIHFANLVFYNLFTLFSMIRDYLWHPIVTRPCILLIICFCASIFTLNFRYLVVHLALKLSS